jgi:hypothetical protein
MPAPVSSGSASVPPLVVPGDGTPSSALALAEVSPLDDIASNGFID